MNTCSHSRVKEREWRSEGISVYQRTSPSLSLLGSDFGRPVSLGPRRFWCVYAFSRSGQVADAAILVGQGVGGGKVGWWPVCSGFLLLVVEGQVRWEGGRHCWGSEVAGKERLRESTHTLFPPPCTFLSALPHGGCEVLMPLPKSPDSRTTVSARATVWEFISVREAVL